MMLKVSIEWAETKILVKLQTKLNGIVSMTTHTCVEWDHIMYVNVHNRKYVRRAYLCSVVYQLVCTNIRKHFITYENLMAIVCVFIVLYNTTLLWRIP